jgi:hypothetical protein
VRLPARKVAATLLRVIGTAAYSAELWHDFFLAIVGAAAALTGLVFVALSINLARIISFPWLPGRAAETVAVLFEALVVAALCLVPQSRQALGWQILAVGVIAWTFSLVIQIRGRVEVQERGSMGYTIRVVFTQVATLPVIVAGVSLLVRAGGGLYWLVPGLVLLFFLGVANAWVLLVEIIR